MINSIYFHSTHATSPRSPNPVYVCAKSTSCRSSFAHLAISITNFPVAPLCVSSTN